MYIVFDSMVSYAEKRVKELKSVNSQNSLKQKAKDIIFKDNKEVIIENMKPIDNNNKEKQLINKEEFIKRKEEELSEQ